MPKSKLSALLSLLLVFFSGATLGVVATRLYMVREVQSVAPPPAPNKKPDPEEVRRRIISEMRDEIGLDQEQVAKLNVIFDRTRESADQVRRKGNAEMRAVWDKQTEDIRGILSASQLPKYESLRQKHEAERKQHKQAGDKK